MRISTKLFTSFATATLLGLVIIYNRQADALVCYACKDAKSSCTSFQLTEKICLANQTRCMVAKPPVSTKLKAAIDNASAEAERIDGEVGYCSLAIKAAGAKVESVPAYDYFVWDCATPTRCAGASLALSLNESCPLPTYKPALEILTTIDSTAYACCTTDRCNSAVPMMINWPLFANFLLALATFLIAQKHRI